MIIDKLVHGLFRQSGVLLRNDVRSRNLSALVVGNADDGDVLNFRYRTDQVFQFCRRDLDYDFKTDLLYIELSLTISTLDKALSNLVEGDNCMVDNHKMLSCIKGTFLESQVFGKQRSKTLSLEMIYLRLVTSFKIRLNV